MSSQTDTISIPNKFNFDGFSSTVDIIKMWARKKPDLVAFEVLKDDKWTEINIQDFYNLIKKIAKGFIASGIKPGDRVAIAAATRYEWVVLDYSIWLSGATTVPIYESSSADQFDWILNNSKVKMLLVETQKMLNVYSQIPEAPKTVNEVFIIDNPDEQKSAIPTLIKLGADISDEQLEQVVSSMNIDNPATVIYTSGTTGRPKGVLLSHKNMLAEAKAVNESVFGEVLVPGTRSLYFLPMAHIFARAVSIACLYSGSTIGHYGDTTTIVPQFEKFKPDYIISVPRIFEKIYAGARKKAVDGGKGKIFDRATQIAINYSKKSDEGKVPLGLKMQYGLYSKLVYGKIKAAMGGNCMLSISGGAPLGERLGHYFRGIGVTIYEGYGLTETTAALTVNTPKDLKIGSVGKPLPGQSVKILEDGEIAVSGSVVFGEYLDNAKATGESIKDAWFYTGDIGKLDNDGYLWVTGRKKEILVTAGGKNVSPAGLEDILRSSPLISQAMVIGDNEPFIAAFVTLDEEVFKDFKLKNKLDVKSSIADLRENPALKNEINIYVEKANQSVSHAEGIKKVRILDRDFTIESGELTQSLKVKRHEVMKNFSKDYEWVYAGKHDGSL